MVKTLYLDIFSGISGDMFIGALLDLGLDFAAFERELAKLGLTGYHLHVSRQQRANIAGTKFDVHLDQDHAHPHEHEHTHTHTDRTTHAHSHDNGHHPLDRAPGPHGGSMVKISAGQVELSVFETNVPPRFRLYFFEADGKSVVPPVASAVQMETIRADQTRQVFKFKRVGGYLEATALLPEPHEFIAILKLKRGNRSEKHETRFAEDHEHYASHGHHHEHGEDHSRNFAAIKQLIANSALSDWVKQKSVAVFQRIAAAEGKIHGLPPERVHFHEVGAVDSIVDIVGACVALEMSGQPRVLASPIVEGTGWVNCAHGRFPIPAPATLEILGARKIGLTQCDEPCELVTPTGAALLAEWVESFGPMRDLVAGKIGYGLGTRENQTRPNVLRAILGESGRESNDWESDTIAVLETNLDDINAEILGGFVDQALNAGALDVFHTPIQMKKNRPGVLLTVLCAEADADKFSELMLRETSAFGVRRTITQRRKLRREIIQVKTSFGEVAVKVGKLNGNILQVAPEYESCKKLAEQANAPLKHIYQAAAKSVRV